MAARRQSLGTHPPGLDRRLWSGEREGRRSRPGPGHRLSGARHPAGPPAAGRPGPGAVEVPRGAP